MATENDNGSSANDEATEFAGKSVAEIRLAAEQGNFQASHRLGNMYFAGEGVEKDEDEATRWWLVADRQHHDANVFAAMDGDAEAQYHLALAYVWGSCATDENSEEHNQNEARKWCRMAAEQGHAEAQYDLGMLYAEPSFLLPADAEECQKWIRMAAGQGLVEAMHRLASMCEKGLDGTPQDFVEAVKWYRLAAEQGDQNSMFQLGRLYAHGRPGVPQDDEEAANWYCLCFDSSLESFIPGTDQEELKRYQLLAARGYSESQYDLGRRYEQGLGVERDFIEAAKWYRLSADQGNALAQFSLGFLYAEGKGVSQDDERAAELYMLAAEQGVAAAQNNLGVMYDAGRGVKHDFRKAVKWFRRSAKQGDETGQYNLGLMYQEGSGVSKNDEEAAKWYRRAAKQRYPWAFLSLGLLRENPEDLKEAAKGLFNLHHAVEYRPLGETHPQMESVKVQLAALIAKKDEQHSKASRSGSGQTLGGENRSGPLLEWKVASTLRGMLEAMSQSTDVPSATSDLERSLKDDDALAGYYLAILAIRGPQKSPSQRRALDYLEATISCLQPYGELAVVLGKDKRDESTGDSYYGKEFETWLLGAARQKHSELKLAMEKEEIHKQTLSYLTHTLNNALSTGPETVRTVIEILGSGLYDRGQEEYKAINNMASLFPVFLFAESLLRTFKLYVSDPEQIREKWKSDKVGDANVSLVMAMALRQSVARFVFSSNHLAQLARLLPSQDKEAIKNIRKSFVDEIIPLEISVETVGKVFEWIKAHFSVLQVEIDADAEIRFTSNATRYMFLFAAFSELIYNALKYSDGQQPITVKWFRHGDDYCFSCANSCPPAKYGHSLQEGTNKGLYFIDKLMSLLEDSELCCETENGEYRALLKFGHENFSEGAV